MARALPKLARRVPHLLCLLKDAQFKVYIMRISRGQGGKEMDSRDNRLFQWGGCIVSRRHVTKEKNNEVSFEEVGGRERGKESEVLRRTIMVSFVPVHIVISFSPLSFSSPLLLNARKKPTIPLLLHSPLHPCTLYHPLHILPRVANIDTIVILLRHADHRNGRLLSHTTDLRTNQVQHFSCAQVRSPICAAECILCLSHPCHPMNDQGPN